MKRSESLLRRVKALEPWFHNLHLPGGIQTAPESFLGDFPGYKWAKLAEHLPRDLRGWRALDIGCNAGFYSFELAKRGAKVVAIDASPHYLRQARWAAGVYGLADAVEFRCMQIYDLARDPGVFDLVLFLGVFYHLRYPCLALDVVRRKTDHLLVFQSLSMPGMARPTPQDLTFDDRATLATFDWPKLAFVEGRLANDPTNWWVPNAGCIEAMLRACGLRITAYPGAETYLCEVDKSRSQWPDEGDLAEFTAAMGLKLPRRHTP